MEDKATEIAKNIMDYIYEETGIDVPIFYTGTADIIRPHLPKELISLPIDDGTDEWWCVWYKCPLCGETWIVNFFNFCPSCGAKINWDLPK